MPIRPKDRNTQRHEKFATLCRNHRKVPPNCNARRISNAPALADLESILPLRGFERSAHLCPFFRPTFPASIFADLAARRYFSRTVFDADSFLVCAQALPNPVENASRNT